MYGIFFFNKRENHRVSSHTYTTGQQDYRNTKIASQSREAPSLPIAPSSPSCGRDKHRPHCTGLNA